MELMVNHIGEKRFKINGIGNFAWVDKDINEKLKIENLSAFVREHVKKDFEIELKTREDLLLLDKVIKENTVYKNKAEWLRSKFAARQKEINS